MSQAPSAGPCCKAERPCAFPQGWFGFGLVGKEGFTSTLLIPLQGHQPLSHSPTRPLAHLQAVPCVSLSCGAQLSGSQLALARHYYAERLPLVSTLERQPWAAGLGSFIVVMCYLIVSKCKCCYLFFLLWFDSADVDIPVRVVPDGYSRDYSPTFINYLMFTFKFEDALFLKATTVIFSGWIVFLRYAAMLLHSSAG